LTQLFKNYTSHKQFEDEREGRRKKKKKYIESTSGKRESRMLKIINALKIMEYFTIFV